MYYRRKIILSLLQEFGGKLKRTDFQKFLFLVSEHQKKRAFDFIPYKYGCYSFQASMDKSTMIKYGLLEESNDWIKKDIKDYIPELKKEDKEIIFFIKSNLGNLSGNELLKYVYNKYPYYAFNSLVSKHIMNEDEMKFIESHKPVNNKKCFYTIGYEGKSLEKYLNQLIESDIKVLIDVRKNPISMKFGFSKNQLKSACEKINVKYLHIPDLGIESDKRQNLNDMSDYENLFNFYSANTLPKNTDNINKIILLLEKHKRIAITCFEKEVCKCHRGKILETITKLISSDWEIENL